MNANYLDIKKQLRKIAKANNKFAKNLTKIKIETENGDIQKN